MDKALLSVENLSIAIAAGQHLNRVVDDLSFSIDAGETVCIAGESGSGKSLSSTAIMGLLPPVAKVLGGKIWFEQRDLLAFSEKEMQAIRGDDIAMIFQEPMTSLNPLMTAGQQLCEAIRAHREVDTAGARQMAISMLDAVKVPHAQKRFGQYPHEMSGGMLQRIMIAMALVCRPKILIADEPTTALDVTIQAQILTLLNELKNDFDTGVLMITHDMGVVAEMADKVVVMNQGIVEEQSDVRSIFLAPSSNYTRDLLAAVPKLGHAKPVDTVEPASPLLEVRNLCVRFPVPSVWWQKNKLEVRAVENVSFSIQPGETLGLVGESGCGKSTTGKALMNMLPFVGSANLNGNELNGLAGQELRAIRKDIQMVFQDPYSSLNPRKTIRQLLSEPLLIHGICQPDEVGRYVAQLLEQVDMLPNHMHRYPHQFSGGQRQRIAIARAIASQPKLIIADESVSALDVSVQAQVLELLERLQKETGVSYLFISHDMAVVEQVSHRVAVMHGGRIVEMGPRDEVLSSPRHSYTQRLMQAVPIADVNVKRDLTSVLSQHKMPDPIRETSAVDEALHYEQVGNGHIVAMNY
ncbi:ABC transporter ATP-binding protein [Vibrio nigripulchritudo]|uniref:ABC transporter ATP-binding protein n=1 Tax=Vibrio nigripulchritudo TaxID=28173 RepID=UPI0003B20FA4|nr:ABC transporter ATP-binding protein [Vibrio nigripulchritudo]CCN73273.1 Glutathione import ATP-binding protein gsiA [Vibrio nigripulchritudo SFn118]